MDALVFAVPTERQRLYARAVLATTVVAYAALVPFSALPLPHIPAFIPAAEGMTATADLLTAVFLYSQFSITRSRALVVLASGYAFAGLVAIVRICTFPGVFAANGLLGAGPESAPWLFIVWKFGFPSAIGAYVILKEREHTEATIRSPAARTIGLAVGLVVGLVVGVAAAVTAGRNYLPQLILNGKMLPLAHYVTVADLSAAALAMLLLSRRQTSVLDRWLMVSLCSATAELTIVAFFIPERYSLGFYVSGVFALMSSLVVLAALHTAVAREYRHMVQSFLAMRREQGNKLLSLEGVTGVLAHEIRQPLAAIRLEARAAREYVGRESANSKEVAKSLDAIARNAIRADEVIGSIRKLFNADNREMKAVDLNEIVADALAQMHDELEARAITVDLSLMADLPRINGHRDQLLQVLLNVLRNAVEALDGVTSGPRIVRIATARHWVDSVLITVEDSGPGIDPEIAKDLFDPFKTTRASGMGLGLTLCRAIIEQHGGEIVGSSPAGAQFQIFLPCVHS